MTDDAVKTAACNDVIKRSLEFYKASGKKVRCKNLNGCLRSENDVKCECEQEGN